MPALRRWLYVSFFNLFLVALLGVTLRYKIAFSLPFLDQKFLLHAHSHFAFAGWITQILMALMVHHLAKYKGEMIFKKYRWLLFGNLITAYGMLVFFPLQGYAIGSITFSTLSIFNAYAFAVQYLRDLKSIGDKSTSHYWFKAALLFNVISSIGAFSLAYMMATKVIHQHWYLAAVYFFLHFQYNGWFFFACMGLLVTKFENILPVNKLKLIFWLFFLACAPAYFLSVLWMAIPLFVYGLVIASAVGQILAWAILVRAFYKDRPIIHLLFSKISRKLFLLSAIALSIKLLLQLGSTHPQLSQLAFGFRPIVIGYLHLVLLGVISIFIFGYAISLEVLNINNYSRAGIWIFVSGIIINEILLMLQGVTGLDYVMLPYINELLLCAAIILFAGILIFFSASMHRRVRK